MDLRAFHKKLFGAAETLMPQGAAISCAISGGIDSMALLHGLLSVNETYQKDWKLLVTHLNHGLRSEAGQDAAFVADEAARLNLPCEIKKVDVRSEARQSAETIEEAARRIRYCFLESAAQRQSADYVATAHHAGDQAETILHRMMRGTSLRGLSGMPASRPIHPGSRVTLVRPMLGFSRQEIAAYVQHFRIEFHHDASNDDLHAATRNRIRHELLPLLREKFNPEIDAALIRLATHAGRAEGALQCMAREALKHASIQQTPGQIRMAVGPLRSLPAAVQSHIAMLALEQLNAKLRDVTLERMEAILDIVAGDGRRRHIELADGVTVERRGRFVIFHKPVDVRDEPTDIEAATQDAHP